MAREREALLAFAEERFLRSRAALLADRLEASQGTGWPRGPRQAPLTPLTISAVDALNLMGDFRKAPELPATITIRDGSEKVAEYVMKRKAEASAVEVERREISDEKKETGKVQEEYDLAWFELLREAEERYLAIGDGWAYLLDLGAATLRAIREGWIRILPEPAWLSDLSQLGERIAGLDLSLVREWFGPPRPERKIAWENGYMQLGLGGNPSARRELSAQPRPKADLTIHAPLPWVKEIARKVRSSPATPAGREELMAFFLERLKEYGRSWKVEPGPLILHPWLRAMSRSLQLRYDLEQLDHLMLARLATQGWAAALGWHSQLVFVVVEGTRISEAILVELFQGGIKRLSHLAPSFPPAPARAGARLEWLAELQFLLWEKEGWTNLVFALDRRLLREEGRLLRAALATSPFGFFRALAPSLVLIRLIRGGGLTVWPIEVFRDVGKWRKREGALTVLYRLIQAPFRGRSPKSRGRLYVRATVMAGAALVALIALIWWLF